MAFSRRKYVGAAAALGTVLAMSLAACGSGSNSTPSGNTGAPSTGTQSGSSPQSSPTQSKSDLIAAANKEGALNLYTTIAGNDVGKVVAAFNKTYPDIKVNTLRLSASDLPPRVITEQRGGKYIADVVTGDSPQVAQLIHAGALQPYDAPDNVPLPADLKLPDGYQSVVYVLTTVIAYNPQTLQKLGLPTPTTWEDLTKPQWKGHFSVDPTAVNWYDSLVVSMGHDKALQLAKDMGNNSPKLVSGHTLALTQVQAGEPAASIAAYGYKASAMGAKDPGTLEFVNTTPLPSSLNLVDVVKNAPHPNAAKLFVDWIVSQQGQQAVIDTTSHTSIRDDVNNDPKVWNPSKWPPAWGQANLPADTYNQYVQELKDAFHSQ